MESQASTLALVPGYHPQREVGYSQTQRWRCHLQQGDLLAGGQQGWGYEVQEKWSESRSVKSDSYATQGLYSPRDSLGQNAGVGSFSLLQGIFPTQGSIPGLPHCRWTLYQLSHKGNSRMLEWVTCPFSSGSSRPSNWTSVSGTAGRFFTNW